MCVCTCLIKIPAAQSCRLNFQMDYSWLTTTTTLSLAVVFFTYYFPLLVQPQSIPSPISQPRAPLPPSPPPPPPLLKPPPPPRLLRAEMLPPPNKKSHSLSSPPPLKYNRPRIPHEQKHNNKTPPPSKQKKLNLGKKIGLLFTGIVAILQVCVITFLVIKSRQMFKHQSNH